LAKNPNASAKRSLALPADGGGNRAHNEILLDRSGRGSPVRVLVVEDFAPFRQVIRSTLQERPELQVIGEATDGLEAVQKAEELQPDLILLDIGLPKQDGIEAARRIRKLAPGCKILFVCQENSPDVVQEALCLGAAGYVVKARTASELLAAVEAVLQGKQFVSASLERDLPAIVAHD